MVAVRTKHGASRIVLEVDIRLSNPEAGYIPSIAFNPATATSSCPACRTLVGRNRNAPGKHVTGERVRTGRLHLFEAPEHEEPARNNAELPWSPFPPSRMHLGSFPLSALPIHRPERVVAGSRKHFSDGVGV